MTDAKSQCARFNYRLSPSKAQAESMEAFFTATRNLFNSALEMQLADAKQKYLAETPADEQVEIVEGKRLPWQVLKKVDKYSGKAYTRLVTGKKDPAIPSTLLVCALRELETAWENYFKKRKDGSHLRPPRFRSIEDRQTFGLQVDCKRAELGAINGLLWIPLSKSPIKVIMHRPLPCVPKMATVIKNPDGTYDVSYIVRREQLQADWDVDYCTIRFPHAEGHAVFCTQTLSSGEIIEHENPEYARLFRRFRRFDASLMRKRRAAGVDVPSSKRYARTRQERAAVHAKLLNIRTNFLHKLSTQIIKSTQIVYIESPNVLELLQDRRKHKSRNVWLSGYRTFITMIQAKGTLYTGRIVNLIDPPSDGLSGEYSVTTLNGRGLRTKRRRVKRQTTHSPLQSISSSEGT